MIKKTRLVSVVTIFALLFSLSIGFITVNAESIANVEKINIENSGFENGEMGWNLADANGKHFDEFSITNETAHEGSSCLKYVPLDYDWGQKVWSKTAVTLKSFTNYKLSFWAKGIGLLAVRVTSVKEDGGEKYNTDDWNNSGNQIDEWKLHTITFNTGADTSFYILFHDTMIFSKDDKYYIDDLKFENLGTTSPNLVANSSFENRSSSWNNATKKRGFEIINKDAHSGKYSIKHEATGDTSSQKAWSKAINLEKFTNYYYSFWAKSVNDGTLNVSIKDPSNQDYVAKLVGGYNGGQNSTEFITVSNRQTAWTRYEGTFKSGNATEMSIFFQGVSRANGYVLIDDLEVRSLATTYTPDNYVVNGDIEATDAGKIAWEGLAAENGYTVATDNFYGGKQSIVHPGSSTNKDKYLYSSFFTLHQNREYELTFYANGTGGNCSVWLVGSDNKKLVGAEGKEMGVAVDATSITDDWVKYTVSIKTKADASLKTITSRLMVQDATPVEGKAVYLDDFKLLEK